MFNVSNQQTTTNRRKITRLFESEHLKFSELQNGYIGSLSVNLAKHKYGHRKNRENLLKHCFANKTPIILGSTMKFAIHEQKEFIRINYFKSFNEIEKAVRVINSFVNS